MTDVTDVTDVAGSSPVVAIPAWRARVPRILVFAGLALAAIGILAITLAWAFTASRSDVSAQLPYLVSGGIGGIAMVVLGVTLTDIGLTLTRRRSS